MKILVVHQYYLHAGDPGGSRFNELCRLWSVAGHQVSVIAGSLNYATGQTPVHLKGRWISREQDGAVTVWRCHVPASYRSSFVGRAWAFLGFTASATTAALRVRGADVVIATSPPLLVAIPGWVAARVSRAKLVFEMRDLHPESAVTTGVLAPNSLVTRMLYGIERWACRTADGINVLTPAFADDLVRRGLAPREKISFVPNGADLDLFRPGSRDQQLRRELGWGDRIVAMYCGAHGRANALGQLLDAAEQLRDRPDLLIACVGDGPEREALERAARERRLGNIVFHGPRPKGQMPELVNACDIGLAVLQRNPTFRTVYPNKVFDYMACARPSLVAMDGIARTLVCDEAQAGVFAQPEDGVAIASAIRRLADDPRERDAMGRRGRAWVETHASRDALAARYLEILQRLRAA